MNTIEEIRNMSTEEIAALNKKFSRKLIKRYALMVSTVFAIHYAADLVDKKLNPEKKN